MPASGYLTTNGIESCLIYLSQTYPAICELILLPEQTHEGRVSRAIKIGKNQQDEKRGVLFIGGVHAREIVNPDMLVQFALTLCKAYTSDSNLVFGNTTYENWVVDLIVNCLDLFIFPLVNPDGRTYVQAPNGDPWWRKNRNPNPGLPCQGVDLNRNYDFLWSSGIGTSPNSCTEIYKGSAPFSEPETRNVRYLLDTYQNIGYMIDVHSYSELILYPWGDDNNQTTDPNMNFRNPIYNGLRGTVGDSLYREYIPQKDLDQFVLMGTRMRGAIAGERGSAYVVQQSLDLYPTTGTSEDYAYSRHFVDSSKRKVTAYVIETGKQFQPPYSEGAKIIAEVSAALVNFCINSLCFSEVQSLVHKELLSAGLGQKYVQIIEDHAAELVDLTMADEQLRAEASKTLQRINTLINSKQGQKKIVSEKLINSVDKLLADYAKVASSPLKQGIYEIQSNLDHFRNRTINDGLKLVARIEVPEAVGEQS